MPGVAVLPNSLGLTSFGAPQLGKTMPTLVHDNHQTSSPSATQSRPETRHNELDPAVIKQRAINNVRTIMQGVTVSSGTLLRTAKKQYDDGKESENNGNLVKAFESFVMAVSLMAEIINRPDSQQGTLLAGIHDFSKVDLAERLKQAEKKLEALYEQQASSAREATGGTSIADRKKALEDSGLSLGAGVTGTRISRTLSDMPPPSSPNQASIRFSTPTIQSSSLPVSTPPPPSPRTLVSPSSLGPPSPPTSPASSFAESFPTIEELEANEQPGTAATKLPQIFHNLSLAAQIEKPPSIPNSPITTSFRPESPTKIGLPRKPSNFSIMSSSTISQQPTPKPLIPISASVTPEELDEYAVHHAILLLDVRSRSDFESGCVEISGAAIACVEPALLRGENLSLSDLEKVMKSMKNVPSEEKSVFANRDKFEIVVLYDENSKSLGATDTPLSMLNRLIATARAEKNKILKRQPMLLIGGLNAWRRAKGFAVASTTSSRTTSSEVMPSIGSPPPINKLYSNNPFYVNGLASPPISNTGYGSSQASSSSSPYHQSNASLDFGTGHSRSPAESSYNTNIPSLNGGLSRRPAIARHYSISSYLTGGSDNTPSSPSTSTYSGFSGQFPYPALTPIPSAAPIKPSQLSRKRTDYDDPSQDAVSDLRMRTQIAYPALSNPPILQPPPPAASSALERQDARPRPPSAPAPVTIPRVLRNQAIPAFNVYYWSESLSPVCGLNNLGNTCYMNATLQCLYATAPFMSFFKDYPWEQSINMVNSLGTKGKVTKSFELLLKDMWAEQNGSIRKRLMTCLDIVRYYDKQYEGNNQHDSQEFFTFLVDKIHEDLNRVLTKPTEPRLTPEQELALEMRDPRRAIDEEWDKWRSANDSIIVDLFQGQFKNRLQCSLCSRTSTTYNAFSILQVSIPPSRGGVPLQECLDGLFRPEELKGDNRWDCPSCKTKRNAVKRLSLARLPPILVIHLKRFHTNSNSAEKIDTFVQCPTKYLEFHASPDMPDETAGGSSTDPRTQVAPYKYELYAVTNHSGQLNSGHYTAHVQSRGDWYRISDTNISRLTSPVVTKEAYVLFYKRVNR